LLHYGKQKIWGEKNKKTSGACQHPRTIDAGISKNRVTVGLGGAEGWWQKQKGPAVHEKTRKGRPD